VKLRNDRSTDEYKLPIHHSCRVAGSTALSEGRQLGAESDAMLLSLKGPSQPDIFPIT
jgi:hypothetical protein